MTHSVFKTIEKRDFFRAQYNSILSTFPFGQKYVDTAYGQTFVLFAGDELAPPVLLLHGSCSNSIFMAPELMALAENYRVYAVDIIGEAGNSDEHRPPLDTDDYASWLASVLDGLGHDKAIICGNSLGGWSALKFAVTFPERVLKLVLLAPSGISRQRPEPAEIAKSAEACNENLSVDQTVDGSQALPREVIDFINLILEVYHPITEELPVFSDELLHKLTMPVLYVAGKLDDMLDSDASARRLGSLVPHAEIHLLENCGHIIQNGPSFIVPFLGKDV